MKYFLAIVAMLYASTAFAQQHVSITIPSQNIKYIVSQNVDVGDVPNHIVRVFDIHDTVPGNIVINGLKITEVSIRGTAELTNGHGGGNSAYALFVAENGDKLFSRSNVSAQPFAGKFRATWAGTITGGTGKLADLQGTMRMIADFDPVANTNGNTQIDIDYAVAQQASGGTAQEARAMLEKAIAAVKADKEVALAMFNKGEGGFRDRDLYPFCARLKDNRVVAGPIAVTAGTDGNALKDSNGTPFGQQLLDAELQHPEGQITEVGPYLFPKPGTTAPTVPKSSFVTRIGDLGCGVGYYK